MKWTKHLTEIKKLNPYCIKASFHFKNAILSIWIVYIPPNDSKKQKEIQQIITKDIIDKRKNEHFIVGGDFNRILDPILDRKGKTTPCTKKNLAVLTWLSKVGFIETYRACNPQGGKFTWKNSRTQTRIDQIWISKDLKLGLYRSDIEDMETYTDSDHNFILAQLNWN